MRRKHYITKKVEEKLEEIEKLHITYEEKQGNLKELLKKTYGIAEEYSIQDIIERKLYLESMLEKESSILIGAFISIMIGLVTKIVEIVWKPNQLLGIAGFGLQAIVVILMMYIIAKLLGVIDTKYRKYNLIDFELKIINKILETEYNYDGIVEDILISRCRRSRNETEI